MDILGGSDSKEPACNAGDGFVGKIPWRRKWQPTPVLLPGEYHGQRSLAGYSPWGRKSRIRLATKPSPPAGEDTEAQRNSLTRAESHSCSTYLSWSNSLSLQPASTFLLRKSFFPKCFHKQIYHIKKITVIISLNFLITV